VFICGTIGLLINFGGISLQFKKSESGFAGKSLNQDLQDLRMNRIESGFAGKCLNQDLQD